MKGATVMGITCFDDIGTNVFETGFDLLSNDFRRYDVDAGDAFGVLDGQRRGRGHCVAAMCGEDFLVGFKATVVGYESVNSTDEYRDSVYFFFHGGCCSGW